MNGVPVEVVYVTIYSRQSWVVLMVDLVAACSMGQYCLVFSVQDFSHEIALNAAFLAPLTDEGSPDIDHMVWETPDMLYPSFSVVQVSVGLNGKLLEQPAAEKRGYTVQKHDSKFQIGVPFDADGRYRKVGCKACFWRRCAADQLQLTTSVSAAELCERLPLRLLRLPCLL